MLPLAETTNSATKRIRPTRKIALVVVLRLTTASCGKAAGLGVIEHGVELTIRPRAGEPRGLRVKDRHQDQRQERAGKEAADDDDGQRRSDEAAGAVATEGQGRQGEHGGDSRHEDGAEPVPATLD